MSWFVSWPWSIDSLNGSLTCCWSIAWWTTDLLIDGLSYWSIDLMWIWFIIAVSVTNWLSSGVVEQLAYWLIYYWLIDWFIGWLVLLIDYSLVDWIWRNNTNWLIDALLHVRHLLLFVIVFNLTVSWPLQTSTNKTHRQFMHEWCLRIWKLWTLATKTKTTKYCLLYPYSLNSWWPQVKRQQTCFLVLCHFKTFKTLGLEGSISDRGTKTVTRW